MKIQNGFCFVLSILNHQIHVSSCGELATIEHFYLFLTSLFLMQFSASTNWDTLLTIIGTQKDRNQLSYLRSLMLTKLKIIIMKIYDIIEALGSLSQTISKMETKQKLNVKLSSVIDVFKTADSIFTRLVLRRKQPSILLYKIISVAVDHENAAV